MIVKQKFKKNHKETFRKRMQILNPCEKMCRQFLYVSLKKKNFNQIIKKKWQQQDDRWECDFKISEDEACNIRVGISRVWEG